MSVGASLIDVTVGVNPSDTVTAEKPDTSAHKKVEINCER